MNLILLWVYLIIVVIFFAFIGIVVMHIGTFKEYSKYLSVVLKIYLISILVIAIFWAYKVSTDYTPAKKNRTTVDQVNF